MYNEKDFEKNSFGVDCSKLMQNFNESTTTNSNNPIKIVDFKKTFLIKLGKYRKGERKGDICLILRICKEGLR